MNEVIEFTSRLDSTEALLEEIYGEIRTCRQAMIMSRAAIGLGLATAAIVFTIAPAYSTAPVVLSAFTAIIGGLVWLGANKSTSEELDAKRTALEAEKADLFDRIAARNGWAASAIHTIH
ncbi:hypothetical protein [Beijerinckia sp. L45]|uniref:hypothetical protein n=1 Tax=Beijerinckia sp. L45 TaxID=1641855 RepID=UPI00131D1247|nr:hypothetical protein [Beijerinckia sp. L45]